MTNRNLEKRRKRRRKRKVKTSVKLIAAASIAVILLGTYVGLKIYQSRHAADPFGDIRNQDIEDDESFEVTDGAVSYKVLDAGNGEAILIKFGNAEALIDTGAEDHAESLQKALKENVNGRLEYLVLSGPGPGRTGCVSTVLDTVSVDTCILGEMGEQDKEIRDKLSKCKSIIDGESMSLDMGAAATLSVIKPDVSSSEAGDRSLVTYFTYGSTGFLALSDAGREEISRAFGDVTACNVVVLSRFGAEEPNLAIPDGTYVGHYVASAVKESGVPSEVLDDHLGGTILTTGENGTIEFSTDGNAVELIEKTPEPEEELEEEPES